MDDPRRPLIPQFSLRWILAVTAVLAVVSLVGSQALRSAAWAGGIAIALTALAVAFLVYAALFVAALLVARMAEARQSRRKNRQAPPVDRAVPAAGSSTAIVLILALGLGGIHASSAWAATGSVYRYPMLGPKQTNKTGLTLAIDTSWVESCGYRPVAVEFKSTTGPLTADRVLNIRLQADTWSSDLAVTQTLEIPAGATSARAIVSVPQRTPWNSFQWDVFEDGKYLSQLSSGGATGFSGGNNSYFGDGAPPSILALSGLSNISANHLTILGQTENTVIFVGWTGPVAITPGPQGTMVGSTSGAMAGPGIAKLADLPTRWIDYSGIDIVLARLDQLQLLIDKHPAQWKAIQKWLASGGSLVVYGVGRKWDQLDELESLTGVAEQFASVASQSNLVVETEVRQPNSERGWSWPAEETRNLTLNGIDTPQPATTAEPSTGAKNPKIQKKFEEAEFVVRPYGDGMLAAIRSDDDFKSDGFAWTWLYNTLGSERWQWFKRYGVSLTRENRDFWNFLIPGVGAAPVTMFQVLITLFVLLIGPVNYYFLRRAGKLNLMMFSVPLFAGLITSGLLTYSIAADGFEVRLRGRSFTQIDQRTGESSCWARLSYYAGLPPSGGLVFSDETIVLPLLHEYQDNYSNALQEINWARVNPSEVNSPLEQRLTDGWLKSRTPTQFVTVRIHKTDAKLVVSETEAGQPPKVENKLGVEIEQLVLIDDSGKCFTGTGLAFGQSTVTTAASSQSAAAAQLTALMNANDPQSQLIDVHYNSGFGIGNYRNRYYYGSNSTSDAYQGSGIMERSLSGLRTQLQNNQLPPRSYVAVVKTSPEMETGTPSAREEASFHVVFGRW